MSDTSPPFPSLEFPTDIVLLVVFWRLRYTLSLRDVAEMFLEPGFAFTHETVRDGEERFAPLMADQLRTKRRGQAGPSCQVDETSIKVGGKWWSLSRALDQEGNLVDWRLSEKRERDAAKQFSDRRWLWLGMLQSQSPLMGIVALPVQYARS